MRPPSARSNSLAGRKAPARGPEAPAQVRSASQQRSEAAAFDPAATLSLAGLTVRIVGRSGVAGHVEKLRLLRAQPHVGRGQVVRKLLHVACAEDDRGNSGPGGQPRDGYLRHGYAVPVGDLAYRLEYLPGAVKVAALIPDLHALVGVF